MNTITIDRIAIERRHREFTYAGLGEDQDLYAAAVGYLISAGWRWMPDSYSPKAGHGWWVLPGDERYGRPMGDSKDFRRGGYKAVQLYTECGIEAIQASAAEYRADRMAKMRGSCSVTNDQEGRE